MAEGETKPLVSREAGTAECVDHPECEVEHKVEADTRRQDTLPRDPSIELVDTCGILSDAS